MKNTTIAMTCIALVCAAFVLPNLGVGAAVTSPATPVKFGMDSASIGAETSAGAKPDYGTFWIGPWTLSSGWGGPDSQMASMKASGVTPAVHFYYWGDDITPSCVENGCWSSLHNAQKNRAGWQTLGDQLVSHMNTKMGGAPVVVFLESEFNKGGISTYEPFDGYMEAMAKRIHQGYPNAVIVLGFGNWDSANWKTFDRAAAASDVIGLQAMRGSTKDSATAYNNVFDATLTGVKTLQSLFGKPIMLTDVALSSYPEPGYLKMQADNLAKFFSRMPELKAAGVMAIIYRSWSDSPQMDLANYYGQAERHWGLAYSATSWKSAATVWVNGVKAERAGATSTSTASTTTTATSTATTAATTTSTTTTAATTTTSTSSTSSTTTSKFTASFTPASGSNEWWVDVKVTGANVAKVETKIGSGAWTPLAKTSYGTWAKSLHAVTGAQVSFRATDTAGLVSTTSPISWLKSMGTVTGSTATGSSTGGTTTGTSTFTATFTPKGTANNYWVETGVTSGQTIVKVESRTNGGSWTVLPKTSYGTYAKSYFVPDNAIVEFRATNGAGATAMSQKVTWV